MISPWIATNSLCQDTPLRLFSLAESQGPGQEILRSVEGKTASGRSEKSIRLQRDESVLLYIIQQNPRSFSIDIPLPDAKAPRRFYLRRFEILDPTASLVVVKGGQTLSVDMSGEFATYRGYSREDPGSWITMNFSRDAINGVFSQHGRIHIIESIEQEGFVAPPRDTTLQTPDFRCGVPDSDPTYIPKDIMRSLEARDKTYYKSDTDLDRKSVV